MRTGRIARIALSAAIVQAAAIASLARADDWPHWRGPQGDGICREKDLLEAWPQRLTPLWSAQVGAGYASPIAKDGRVYLFHLVDRNDTLTCFDAASGKVIWKDSNAGGWRSGYAGTRATPNIGGKSIYTYGGGGNLLARDLATGRQLWHLNVLHDNKSQPLEWGQASNPLIDGDLIYVQSGRGGPVAVAVNKNDGKVVWRSQATGTAAYAHPIIADVQGTRQLIVFAAAGPIAMDPATGKTLWHIPWQTQYDVNASDPIYHDGHLFISSDYGRGAMMLRLSPTGAQKIWETQDVMMRFQPAILDRGHLYVNSEGTLKCLRWPAKQILWATRNQDRSLLGMGGSMVRVGGDKLIVLSQSGRLSLIKATPQGYERISSVADVVEGGEVWATPVIHDGRLFVRGDEELVCIDIKAK